MYINAVGNTVMLHLYIHDSYNIIFKIKQTNYTDIASGSDTPVEKPWCAPACNISINKLTMRVRIPRPYILTNGTHLYTWRVLSMHDT